MTRYIQPRNQHEAERQSWMVKCLKFLGALQIIGCAILGAVAGGPFISVWLVELHLLGPGESGPSAALLGFAAGLIAGMFSSLLYFALAQVIDDLHAIRVQTSAYVSFESDSIQ